MKKTIIIAAAFILSAGALSSQVKVNNNPTVTQTITVQKSISADRKDLASGD
ncbi:MAG: hypothetical protein ACTHNW_16720 [Mucilaginibacter sp.]